MTLPPQPVSKTREALAAYEDAGNEVPTGIWYEVAIAEYLNEMFKKGLGARVVLYSWGSYEDTVLGRDAILCLPGSNKGIPIDFTTDDRRKKNLVFMLDKRWFDRSGRSLQVQRAKMVLFRNGVDRVANDIMDTFGNWFTVANQFIPKVDQPT